jgi:hypothetical protein
MTTQISPLPIQRFYDNNNFPLSGGQLYTYIAGTTTPLPTFTDSTGVTANSNPVVMNARGEANVWMTANQGYKFVLKDASWNTIWTEDNLYAAGAIGADLANLTDPTKGTALVGFKLNATGSVGRTLSSKLQDRVSVKDFGATGDGTTDDTAAIQAATTWAGGLGKQLYFPIGNYLYSGITMAAGQSCSFIGESTANTILTLNSGTAIGFNCATELSVTFEKLTFSYKAGVTGSAGSFIALPGGATMNANSRFRHLQMNNPWIGINATGAYVWVADTCFIGNYLSAAIVVGNSFVGDAGDSTIKECLFTTVSTTAKAILHLSSGGLRINNNKCIGGFAFYQLSLAAGVNTSDLLVTGNSIEGTASSGLLAGRQGSTGTFSNITITGNQFAGIQFPVNFNDGTAGWLSKITITGNAIPIGPNGVGVNLSASQNFIVAGNAFSGGNPACVAVTVAASSSGGTIGSNNYSGCTVAISNLSTTTDVVKKVLQGVSGTVVCSTAAGSVFTGTVAVAFPANFFGSSPLVTVTVSAGGGGISGAVSGVTGSGFTLMGIGATNGTNLACTWRAEADY